MTRSRALYEFGDFALDLGQQVLLRLDSGETIPLTAKVFDTLVYLVEHAGEPLDKEVLLQAIWPALIVEANSLTQNISTLRQVLGEARGAMSLPGRLAQRRVSQRRPRRRPPRRVHESDRSRWPQGC